MPTYAEPRPKNHVEKPAGSFSRGSGRGVFGPQRASPGASAPITRLQAMMDSSRGATQLKEFQKMADRKPQARELAQLQTRMNQRGSDPLVLDRPAVHSPVASGDAAIQAKWITRPDQSEPVWVPDDYVLQHGEVVVDGPRLPPQYGLQSQPEFRARRRAIREALNIPNQDIDREKIGFPFKNFFDVQRTGVNIHHLVSNLPSSLTAGGHLERLLRTSDLAHQSQAVGETVPYNKVREDLTKIQYAQNIGLDPGSIKQPSPEIDAEAQHRTTGEKVQFDPLTSDQNPKPTPKSLAAWAEAYHKHTNESKGKGVTGVWDITTENTDQLGEHFKALDKKNLKRGRSAIVDLRLDEELALEDHYAQIYLKHKNRRAEEAKEKESELRRKRSRKGTGSFSPTGIEAPPWGGPGPGAFDPYGVGQNHPLYTRWRRDDGATS